MYTLLDPQNYSSVQYLTMNLFFQVFPLFLMSVLGDYHGLPGLYVAAVFAAALRSASTCSLECSCTYFCAPFEFTVRCRLPSTRWQLSFWRTLSSRCMQSPIRTGHNWVKNNARGFRVACVCFLTFKAIYKIKPFDCVNCDTFSWLQPCFSAF